MYIVTSDNKRISVGDIAIEYETKEFYTYPSLRIDLNSEITASTLQSFLLGGFTLYDDEGTELEKYEGYSTLGAVSIRLNKVVESDKRIAELNSEISDLKSKNTAYETQVSTLEAENAELLFNNSTGSDYNTSK